jgi:hypothetical protein
VCFFRRKSKKKGLEQVIHSEKKKNRCVIKNIIGAFSIRNWLACHLTSYSDTKV